MSQETEKPIGIVRKQQKPFIMSPTHICHDSKISAVAYKLWNVIESKPDPWKFFWYDILKSFKEGRDKVKNSLKELEKFGYVKKNRAKKGNIYNGMDIQVFYDPNLPFTQENQPSARVTEFQSPEDQLSETRSSENQSTNKEGLKEDKNNLNKTHSKDLKAPLTPQEEKRGFYIFEGGSSRLVDFLSEQAKAQAKKNAPGWSLWELADVYIAGIKGPKGQKEGREPPDDINKAFPGWCKSYTKGKKPG